MQSRPREPKGCFSVSRRLPLQLLFSDAHRDSNARANLELGRGEGKEQYNSLILLRLANEAYEVELAAGVGKANRADRLLSDGIVCRVLI